MMNTPQPPVPLPPLWEGGDAFTVQHRPRGLLSNTFSSSERPSYCTAPPSGLGAKVASQSRNAAAVFWVEVLTRMPFPGEMGGRRRPPTGENAPLATLGMRGVQQRRTGVGQAG